MKPASSVSVLSTVRSVCTTCARSSGQTGATRRSNSSRTRATSARSLRIADVAEHRARRQRVLHVPDHHALRAAVGEAAQRLPEARRRLAPRDERGVGELGGGDAAVAGQHVVEPHGVPAPLGAQPRGLVADARRPGVAGRRRPPRQGDPQLGIDGVDVQRRGRLHVEHVRILGRVGDLQHGQRRAAFVLQEERAVALAAEVARGLRAHPEERRADLDGVGGRQARRRAGHDGVHHAGSLPRKPVAVHSRPSSRGT